MHMNMNQTIGRRPSRRGQASFSFALAILLTAGGCSASIGRTGSPQSSTSSGTAAEALPNHIRWVRDSAEYAALTIQAYRVATARVEVEGKNRPPGSWGVVVDADDTIINNLPYQIGLATEGARHTPERFTAWVKTQASTPVPGARQFLARVRSLGGRIAVVTNRLAIECDDTAAVLGKLGLAFDAVLCRPENDAAVADKNPRFQQVAQGQSAASRVPLHIVLFVGDNIQDFPGGRQSLRADGEDAFAEFGLNRIVLPNPMYGSWQ